MARKKAQIAPHLYENDSGSSFAMFTDNLLTAEAFINLNYKTQMFYIHLCSHKNTPEQKMCLFNTLRTYYSMNGIEKSIDDLKLEAGQVSKSAIVSNKFVCPESQMKKYGYRDAHAMDSAKKELIAAGFIKVVGFGKKQNTGYKKTPTLYAFSNDWKRGSN